jgi:putative membrane protein
LPKERNYNGIIIAVSILLPLVIALLFITNKIEGYDFSFLPPTYALTNGLTFLCLVAGVLAIKNGKKELHKKFMTSAIVFSIYFLVAYVLYHVTTPSTKFGGEGTIRIVYLFILFTHIACSMAVVPLVLITYVKAISQRFDQHRKIARYTFPLWTYVSLTGVIVYLMISPYYV